jgi:hypothetical protein
MVNFRGRVAAKVRPEVGIKSMHRAHPGTGKLSKNQQATRHEPLELENCIVQRHGCQSGELAADFPDQTRKTVSKEISGLAVPRVLCHSSIAGQQKS